MPKDEHEALVWLLRAVAARRGFVAITVDTPTATRTRYTLLRSGAMLVSSPDSPVSTRYDSIDAWLAATA